MKKENNSWALVAPIVVLVLIGTIVTAALAVTNNITAPIIAEQQAKAADAAKQVVLPDGSGFSPVESLEGLPDAVIAADQAGNGAGFVITTETKGFGGVIQAMFGIDSNGIITGSKVVKHDESPGIGAVVAEDGSEFQAQLIGMSDTANIQARSGATVTSNSMKTAVQAALDAYTILTGGTVEATVYQSPTNLTDDDVAAYFPGVSSITEVVGGKVTDKGTVVYASAQGLMSEVRVAVFFDESDSIVGLVVDASGETPGIGDKAAQKDYTDQFIGVSSGDDVDVISGSTLTSTAVKDSVNLAIANLAAVKVAEEADVSAIAPAESEAPAAADPLEEFYPGVAFTDVPNGKTSDQGTVVYASAEGFGGGLVDVTVCFDTEDNILGLAVDASTQTPGIGTMATEPEYLEKFVGVKSGDDVDVCSGATFTSTAIKSAVNTAIENLDSVKAGNGLPEAPAESEEPVESVAPAADDVTITATAQGFGGQITATVTFGADGAIKGLSVKTPDETAGLGARCSESSFTNKFIGAKSASSVDSIAGATVTSTAVKNAVNAAADAFKSGKTGPVSAGGPAPTPAPAETTAPVETPAPVQSEAPSEAPAAGPKTITASAQGMGTVTVTVTFDANGVITALSVDTSGETPGLGTQCSESGFTSKFIGATGGSGVDAISGVTITSNAVKDAVNSAAAQFKSN